MDIAKSSKEGYQLILQKDYGIILSDISRGGKHDEGIRFHKELLEKGIDLPMIFYVGFVEREKGTPPFSFGIADNPIDVIHLVLDVLQRKYYLVRLYPFQA